MREVVDVICSTECIDAVAGEVELADLEQVCTLASTPMTDNDCSVTGLHSMARFRAWRHRDLLLELLLVVEDEQLLCVERRHEDATVADRQRVRTQSSAKQPPSHLSRRGHLPQTSNTVWLVRAAVGDVELVSFGAGSDVVRVIHVEHVDVVQTIVGLGVENVDGSRQFADDVQQAVKYRDSTNYVRRCNRQLSLLPR